MTDDPLNVLASGDVPVTPDPGFASRLRSRLEAAAKVFEQQPDRTEGVMMSGTDTVLAELSTSTPRPAATSTPRPAATSTPRPAATSTPRPAAVPYLAVPHARAALTWYQQALGATPLGEPVQMDDGRIGHAELALAGGVLYLADEYPEIGLKAPRSQEVSVSLVIAVPDTDSAVERAREHGAQVQREPYEAHGARTATVIDPFGHRWMLTGPVTGAVVPIQHGDVGFVSLRAPDAERAAAFYRQVLGWIYDPATHLVTNTDQHIGIHSAPNRQPVSCCYAVADLAGARDSIVAGGGTVGAAREFDFGTVLDATDPQGLAFAVFRPRTGETRPAVNGTGPGELAYLTYQVPDSSAFKAFYSRVLFWSFEPGRIDDGWQVVPTHPMAGVAGSSDSASVVPMWTVEDIDAAVARVRAAGGTIVEEPSTQSYGTSALCADDQGARFYLGEF